MSHVPGPNHPHGLMSGGLGGHPACPVSDTYANGAPAEAFDCSGVTGVTTAEAADASSWEQDTSCCAMRLQRQAEVAEAAFRESEARL